MNLLKNHRPGLPVILFLLAALGTFAVYTFINRPSAQHEHEEKEAGGIAESMEEWFEQRAYPALTIDMERYANAYEQMRTQMATQKTSSNHQWEALGPKNFGGRTLFLAFNPQNASTLFAGAAGGGLWRSYSTGVGANAWQHVPVGFPVVGVAAIALAPNDTNVIYIGTGEVYNYQNVGTGFSVRLTRGTYGIGILKSTDYGATWVKSLDWAYDDMRGVQDIVVNPLHPNTVWAATSEGTYVSYDAGATWILKHNVLMATDIEMHPTDTSLIFIASGNLGSAGNGIYRTQNGGNTFTQLTSGLPASYSGKTMLSFSPSTPTTIYASIGDSLNGKGLYRSNNSGNTWALVNSLDYPLYQGWYSHDVAVSPVDPNFLMCVGVDSYRSTNSGTNLNQRSYWYKWDLNATTVGGSEGPNDYMHGDIHHILFKPGGDSIIYFATDGGVFRTLNRALTFEGCNGSYQTQQFYANFSNSATDSLFAIGGMQDNATAIYEGNAGWRRVIGGDGMSTAIDQTNDNKVYASYQYLNVYRSDDKAQSFNYLSNLPTGNAANTNFNGIYEVCEFSPNYVYAARDLVYQSVDYGASWITMAPLDGNPINTIAIDPNDCERIYVGTTPRINPPAKIFKSTNGGNSWTNVTGILPDRFPMDIAIHPVNNDILYAVYSGFGTPHIYKSTNGAATWTALTGLPDVPTNTVVIDPLYPDYVYVGNDFGVYYSPDGGNSWNTFNDGLTDATLVMHMSISHANRKLRIATHGKGIWERPLIDPTITSTQTTALATGYLHLSPNPVVSQLSLRYRAAATGPVTLRVMDMSGKLVMESKETGVIGVSKEILLNTSSLRAGTYYVVMQSEDSQLVRKMVKVQ